MATHNHEINNMNFISKKNLILVKSFPCGLVAYSNPSETKVAFFSEVEGGLLMISGWIENKNKSLLEIVEEMY